MKTQAVFAKKITLALTILLAIVLLGKNQVQAQSKWKDYLITGSAMFLSGAIDGTKESICYHYDRGFKRRLPGANDQFWNPEISWKNKYKNRDCNLGPKFTGSTNVLVFTTDAYHALRTAKSGLTAGVLAYYVNKSCSDRSNSPRKKRWKKTAKDFLILTAIRCAGFNLTYNFIFNPSRKYLVN